MLLELNCNYYPKVFYKKDVVSCSQSKSTNKLVDELRKMITVYKKFFQHI